MSPHRMTILAPASILAAATLFSSCQQFFTTSVAAVLARPADAVTIPANITVTQATALLQDAIANGDAALAGKLVTPLLAAATAAASDPSSAAFQEAASALLDAAVLSSGVGSAITEASTLYLSAGDTMTDEELVANVVDVFSSVTLDDAAEEALILVASNAAAIGMSADDAFSSAAALAADALSETGQTLEDLTAGELETLAETDPSVAAAIDLLEYAGSLPESDSSMFGSLLSSFGISGGA